VNFFINDASPQTQFEQTPINAAKAEYARNQAKRQESVLRQEFLKK
jgi:hypothetical protein